MIRKDIVLPSKMPLFSLEMLMRLCKGYFSFLSSLEMWQNNHDGLCLYFFNVCSYLQVSEASAFSQVLTRGILGLLLGENFLGNINVSVLSYLKSGSELMW